MAAVATPASGTVQPISLGAIGFGSMVVDNAHGHVFVSGPAANVIDVFDLKGSLVKTFSSESGAMGMVIVGSNLYVALQTTGIIERIDLATLSDQTAIVSGLVSPKWLAFAGGRLWTFADGSNSGPATKLESITLGGSVTTFPGTPSYNAPMLATTSGSANTLFVAEGFSPGAIHRLDVSTGAPVTEANTGYYGQGYIFDLAVSPDGSRVITNQGTTDFPYVFTEFDTSTLQPDGFRYPGEAYPSAIAVSPGHGGLVATGLDQGYTSHDVEVHSLGNTAQIFTAGTNLPGGVANVVPHGLAMTDDGSHLFVITADDPYLVNFSLHAFTITIVPPSPLGWLPSATPYPASPPWLTGATSTSGLSVAPRPGPASAAAIPNGGTRAASCSGSTVCGSSSGAGPAASLGATPRFTG